MRDSAIAAAFGLSGAAALWALWMLAGWVYGARPARYPYDEPPPALAEPPTCGTCGVPGEWQCVRCPYGTGSTARPSC